MDNTPEDAARQALRTWHRRAGAVAADRDPLVADAIAAGLTKEEVHVITGLGRNTIDRILSKAGPR